MNEDLIKIKLAGLFSYYYYHRLKKLSCADQEETDEYLEIIDKLKKVIKAENEVYAGLSERDLRTCSLEIDTYGINNEMDSRKYMKIQFEERKRKHFVLKNGVLLSDAISSKILIDILKGIEKKIEEFSTNPESVIEDICMLQFYHNIHKYDYLTSNNYIEALALRYDFDISRIPALYFTDIENKFDVEFVKNLQPIFLNYAKESLEELTTIDTDDRYFQTYISLFELMRLNVVLENLNYDTVKQLLGYFNDNYDDTEDVILASAKSLIKKKKKEFEK